MTNPFAPQTPLDKFFSPFAAVFISTNQDVSADALFGGQTWQHLSFGFQGATGNHTLTMPEAPPLGLRVTVSDVDGSVNVDGKTIALLSTVASIMTYNGSSPSRIGPVAAGSSAVAIRWAFGSGTWEWNGALWSLVSYVQNIDRSGAS